MAWPRFVPKLCTLPNARTARPDVVAPDRDNAARERTCRISPAWACGRQAPLSVRAYRRAPSSSVNKVSTCGTPSTTAPRATLSSSACPSGSLSGRAGPLLRMARTSRGMRASADATTITAAAAYCACEIPIAAPSRAGDQRPGRHRHDGAEDVIRRHPRQLVRRDVPRHRHRPLHHHHLDEYAQAERRDAHGGQRQDHRQRERADGHRAADQDDEPGGPGAA